MRLGTRIFICYLAIFIVCFYYPVHWTLGTLRVRYLEGVEDPLVDQASILAAMVGSQIEAKEFRPEKLYQTFESIYRRPLPAKIYDFEKTRVDTRVYITDAGGKVIFDSEDRGLIGADYSNWRDIKLTLNGKYGARSTRQNLKDPTSSVLYVASPIVVDGRIAGVLTVAKPTTNINNFLKSARPRLLRIFGIFGAAAVLLSLFVSMWITGPIRRLTRYANEVREGRRSSLPRLNRSEIGEMGKAFEKMREALEGKRYVEEYIHSFTHEIKSPLSAIRGAAELLGEEMDPQKQAHFLTNIRNEASRIQNIVDRMLELSKLENLKNLEKKERISMHSLVKTVLEGKQILLSKKNLRVSSRISSDVLIEGDAFLLYQALSNLIQNAIDFSPAGGRIELAGQSGTGRFRFSVRDYGPGIPEYAKARVFEKFFSLQRPDTAGKSTGLGLNFVREVAVLHRGEVSLENCVGGGACATLTLPHAIGGKVER
ncbi:MAG: two-component system sensor histidine kinase CreC [Thermodesulfobacteriota bacterium]